jgi:aryl-alcohol dehydrogenase-like predicted oxidoreductase
MRYAAGVIMKTIQLGNTDLQVSRLCLGCMTYGEPTRGNHTWTLPEASSRPLIQQALNAGINFFDTANSYSDGSSEEILGRALKDFARRDEVVVATKVYFPLTNLSQGLSRHNILQSIDDSLQRLGMEYVDLLQIHRWDYDTPLEETLEALHDVVQAGKARYIGASSMHASQFAQALSLQKQQGWHRFVSMQDQYNLIQREEEREMHPLCLQEQIAVLPWSPLARGKLTRPWGETTARSTSDKVMASLYANTEENDAAIAQRLAQVAEDKGVTRAQVALAWLLSKPAVTAPIIGASRAEQFDDLVKAVDVTLSEAEIATLEEVYQPHQAVGFE